MIYPLTEKKSFPIRTKEVEGSNQKPPRQSVSISELRQYLRKYCLHDALSSIGILSNLLLKRDEKVLEKYKPNFLHEFGLAFLAIILIDESHDHKSIRFDENALIECMNRINNLSDPLLKIDDLDTDESKKEAIDSFIVRMSYQQFPFQVAIKHLVPRMLYMFDIIPKTITNPKIDIPKAIKEIYGLSAEEIAVIGFCIFAISDAGYININRLTGTEIPNLKLYLTEDKVNQFISMFSADYYKIREHFRKENIQEGFEKYTFNSLKTYPIVKSQIAGLIVPSARFLIEKISLGLYYDLMDHFKNDKGNPFLEFFGKDIFEKYVGLLLKKRYPKTNLFPEWKYGGSRHENKKTSDWIILSNDDAIFIECKTSGLAKEAKTMASKEDLLKSLNSRVVGGILQMQKIVEDVRSNKIGLEKLAKIKNFYFIIVTYDKMFLVNTPSIKELIDKELLKAGYPKIEYQIMSIDELEYLTAVLGDFDLVDLLNEKDKEEWKVNDFGLFIEGFLKSKGKNSRRENPMLTKKFNQFFRSLTSKNIKQ